MLTLLTATGARPEAWAICERLMARQDYAGPVRWVVVDDGPEPQPVTFARDGWELTVVRPEPVWAPGKNTQARNLRHGLDRIPPDARVVVIEDDDWYARDWLTHVAGELDRSSLVGERRSRYYNVITGCGKAMENTDHASLCSTAVRGKALAALRTTCVRGRHIDLRLWKRGGRLFDGCRVVGIKGLPGRGGIGQGHRGDFGEPVDLRQWIGEDAGLYERFP